MAQGGADITRCEIATDDPEFVHQISPNRVTLETAREIVRMSELYLEGTVKFALASDSRATSITGILSASTTALVTAGLTLMLSGPTSGRGKFLLGVGAFTTSLIFMFALWNTVQAVRPRNFSIGGTYLKNVQYKKDLYGNLNELLLQQAAIYQDQIEDNTKRLRRTSCQLNTALKYIAFAPIVSAAAVVIAYFALWAWDVYVGIGPAATLTK